MDTHPRDTIPGPRIDAILLDAPPDRPAAEVVGEILGDAESVVACLDAARIVSLPEMLEADGAPHLCLYRGRLGAEAAEVAPRLVRLTAQGAMTRRLATAAGAPGAHPFAFREAEAGIFLRTGMPIEALRRRLRRFLRVETAEGGAFLFRCWEPSVAVACFAGIADRPDLILRRFRYREGGAIDAIVAPLPAAMPPATALFAPVCLPSVAPPPAGRSG